MTKRDAKNLIDRIHANVDLSRRLPRDQAEVHSLKAMADLNALWTLLKETGTAGREAKFAVRDDAPNSVTENCPCCGSQQPHLHPAFQFEGEVEICAHEFHERETPQNRPEYIAAVRAKRLGAQGR